MSDRADLRRLAEAAIDSMLGHYSGDVAIDVDTFYRPVLDLLDKHERLQARLLTAERLLWQATADLNDWLADQDGEVDWITRDRYITVSDADYLQTLGSDEAVQRYTQDWIDAHDQDWRDALEGPTDA